MKEKEKKEKKEKARKIKKNSKKRNEKDIYCLTSISLPCYLYIHIYTSQTRYWYAENG